MTTKITEHTPSTWDASVKTGSGIDGAVLNISREWPTKRNRFGGLGEWELHSETLYPSSDEAWAAWASSPLNPRNKARG